MRQDETGQRPDGSIDWIGALLLERLVLGTFVYSYTYNNYNSQHYFYKYTIFINKFLTDLFMMNSFSILIRTKNPIYAVLAILKLNKTDA